jgi:hypothetical protein
MFLFFGKKPVQPGHPLFDPMLDTSPAPRDRRKPRSLAEVVDYWTTIALATDPQTVLQKIEERKEKLARALDLEADAKQRYNQEINALQNLLTTDAEGGVVLIDSLYPRLDMSFMQAGELQIGPAKTPRPFARFNATQPACVTTYSSTGGLFFRWVSQDHPAEQNRCVGGFRPIEMLFRFLLCAALYRIILVPSQVLYPCCEMGTVSGLVLMALLCALVFSRHASWVDFGAIVGGAGGLAGYRAALDLGDIVNLDQAVPILASSAIMGAKAAVAIGILEGLLSLLTSLTIGRSLKGFVRLALLGAVGGVLAGCAGAGTCAFLKAKDLLGSCSAFTIYLHGFPEPLALLFFAAALSAVFLVVTSVLNGPGPQVSLHTRFSGAIADESKALLAIAKTQLDAISIITLPDKWHERGDVRQSTPLSGQPNWQEELLVVGHKGVNSWLVAAQIPARTRKPDQYHFS